MMQYRYVYRKSVSLFPGIESSFVGPNSDPSDRTLIRVLRSEFEQDEKAQASSKKKGMDSELSSSIVIKRLRVVHICSLCSTI